MWLLHVESYELVGFIPGEIPRYAILSHTWGADEVIFADMQSPERRQAARSKAAWRKIEYTCRQAREDDLAYAWIDTCCIDKSSSAELSEAINSMFAWYRDADVCYAYLEDVKTLGRKPVFALSRWFTRGWTLQELLAPETLIFFSDDWTKINDRASLSQPLAKITGIDEGILTGLSHLQLRSASIAKRMSWAARRRTTRPEDTAYSLLGIFDVNMPLLYGEGAQKAFLRLQQEIMRTSHDHSLFVWVDTESPLRFHTEDEYFRSLASGDLLRPYGLLAPSPRCFENSGSIIYDQASEDVLEEPYSMTNLGLRINLHLIPLSSELCTAVLNCLQSDREYFTFIGLHLRKLGPRQFARVGAGFTEVSARRLKWMKRGKRVRDTIYVRQTNWDVGPSSSIVYKTLPPGKYIRLLHVRTVGPSIEDFECSFHLANLDAVAVAGRAGRSGRSGRSQPPEYTAISYCWGDAAPTCRLKFVNGQSLLVSQTLHDLLESLRIRHSKGIDWSLGVSQTRHDLLHPLRIQRSTENDGSPFETTLWIDAICINQADTRERETQVDLMDKIYSSAERVLVWLGISTPGSQRAFRLQVHKSRDFKHTLVRDDFFLLFARPWFHRVWIIQEITLNQNVHVVCGADSRPFEWLVEVGNLCQRFEMGWGYVEPFANLQEGLSDIDKLALQGRNNLRQMREIREAFWGTAEDGVDLRIPPTERLRWEMLLMTATSYKASDLRDKVYALRGITKDQRSMPRPNYDPPCPQPHRYIPGGTDLRFDDSAIEEYRKAVDELFTDTARALLCDGRSLHSLDLLVFAGESNGSGHEGLPTWAPDLAQDSTHDRAARATWLLYWAQARGWNAGGPSDRAATPVAGQVHMIRLLARGFNVVDVVCPPFVMTSRDTSVALQQGALNAVMALRGQYFGNTGDKEWDNMLCDVLLPGTGLNISPRRRASFHDWQAWVRASTSDYDLATIQKNWFYRSMHQQCPSGWRVFATRGGLLGLGPPRTRIGDLVFLVPGCWMPMLFRPKTDGWETESRPCMRLQSWCYVHGAMNGEQESWGFKEWELDVE